MCSMGYFADKRAKTCQIGSIYFDTLFLLWYNIPIAKST